jgi:hypothetical protein
MTVQVSHRSFEPMSRVHKPPGHDCCKNCAQGNWGIIEGVGSYRVVRWEKEHRARVADPEEGNRANRTTEFAEVKRSRVESVTGYDQATEDRNGIPTNPSNCADGSDCSKNYIDSQNGEA